MLAGILGTISLIGFEQTWKAFWAVVLGENTPGGHRQGCTGRRMCCCSLYVLRATSGSQETPGRGHPRSLFFIGRPVDSGRDAECWRPGKGRARGAGAARTPRINLLQATRAVINNSVGGRDGLAVEINQAKQSETRRSPAQRFAERGHRFRRWGQ